MKAKVISQSAHQGGVFKAKPSEDDPQMKREVLLLLPSNQWCWYALGEVELINEPSADITPEGVALKSGGITGPLEDLRDKIAIAAMQAIVSNPTCVQGVGDATLDWVPEWSYKLADAMLKRREAKC